MAEAGAWRYAFIYEIVQRHFPDLPEQARQITRAQARRVLVLQYLDNVAAADRKMIGKVFHVLKWTPTELDRTTAALLQKDAVREMQVERLGHPQSLPTRTLERDL